MSQLLSQGGFGCVYYPGLNCKGKSLLKKNVVSKLQKNNFNSINEIYIGKIIKTIPLYIDFFLPVIKSCQTDIRLFDKNLISECQIIKGSKNKYILMDIPYVPNKPFVSIFEKDNKHILLILTETFTYLLKCISKLLNINIVHFDLKADNILYNSLTNNPQIIDFGISIPIKNLNKNTIKDFFYIYAPEYYIWPLEVHIINYLVNETQSKLTTIEAKLIVENYVKSNSALSIFSPEFISRYQIACEKEINKFVDKSREIVIEQLIKFYKTWDNYSLSIIYLKLFEYIFPDGYYKNTMLISLSQLLLININPNPTKRLSIEDTLKKFQNIFYKDGDVSSYLDVAKNIITTQNTVHKFNNDINSLKFILNKNNK